MSDELQELYQETILDHNRRPRNFRSIEGAQRSDGYNPLCGDRVTVFARIDRGVITDVAFQGSGCAISKASASLMTDAVKGRSVEEAQALIDRFHDLVTGEGPTPPDAGKLAVLAGVRQFPARVKCASLAWHTLKAAVQARSDVVSTE